MTKKSIFLEKMNIYLSRIIIASTLLLTATLYALVVKYDLKAPQFGVTPLKASAPEGHSLSFVEAASTEELIALFEEHDYSLDLSKTSESTLEVPALYLDTLPDDFAKNLTIA